MANHIWRPFEVNVAEDRLLWRPYIAEERPLWQPYRDCLEENNHYNQDKIPITSFPIEVQNVVLNMFRQLLLEKNNKKFGITQRISQLTGINRITVSRILKKGEATSRKKPQKKKLAKITDAIKADIKDIIYEYFSKRISPTLEDVTKKIRLRQIYFPYKSISSLRKIIVQMGFSYKLLNKRIHLTESLRIKKIEEHFFAKNPGLPGTGTKYYISG